jgi:hypothetical protein
MLRCIFNPSKQISCIVFVVQITLLIDPCNFGAETSEFAPSWTTKSAAVDNISLLLLVVLLQVAEHLRRRLMMARSCSSAAGSCALPRSSMHLPRPQQQQQQQFSLTGFGSWDLQQPSGQQQQQQEQLPLLDAALFQLPAVPDHNLIITDTSQAPGQEQQLQQQQGLQVQDDGGLQLRQQLAWQALQQQQQQQQSYHMPADSGQHLGQQQEPLQQQQQNVLPLPQHPSPRASPTAARRLVHSSSGSSNDSGSSGTGLSSLGLPRPIARTSSMQQLIDAAKQAAGVPAGAGAAADSAAAAAAVAYKQWHANVSVLFADVQGYTELADKVEPEQVGLVVVAVTAHVCDGASWFDTGAALMQVHCCHQQCCGVCRPASRQVQSTLFNIM